MSITSSHKLVEAGYGQDLALVWGLITFNHLVLGSAINQVELEEPAHGVFDQKQIPRFIQMENKRCANGLANDSSRVGVLQAFSENKVFGFLLYFCQRKNGRFVRADVETALCFGRAFESGLSLVVHYWVVATRSHYLCIGEFFYLVETCDYIVLY